MNGQVDWLTDWLEAMESQPGRPLWLSPLSDLSEPSHHTQLFTVKTEKKQLTDHYEHAKDGKQQSVGQINNSLTQVRKKQDKELRSPLHVYFIIGKTCFFCFSFISTAMHSNVFEVGLELIRYQAASMGRAHVFALKSVTFTVPLGVYWSKSKEFWKGSCFIAHIVVVLVQSLIVIVIILTDLVLLIVCAFNVPFPFWSDFKFFNFLIVFFFSSEQFGVEFFFLSLQTALIWDFVSVVLLGSVPHSSYYLSVGQVFTTTANFLISVPLRPSPGHSLYIWQI